MQPNLILLAVNAALLIILIFVIVIIIRLGVRHEYNYGIAQIQWPIKLAMMRFVLFLVVLALAAAIFNIYGPQLLP